MNSVIISRLEIAAVSSVNIPIDTTWVPFKFWGEIKAKVAERFFGGLNQIEQQTQKVSRYIST